MDKEDATKRAANELKSRLEVSLSADAKIISSEEKITDNPDGTFTLTITFECLEDIACELPIELSE